MKKNTMFSTSVVYMDLLDIKSQLKIMNKRADFFHIDIMDGHFVSDLSFGPAFLGEIKKISEIPVDCHLMVTNPEIYIDEIIGLKADFITLHIETIDRNAFALITKIREAGLKVGMAVNLGTPIQKVYDFLEYADKVTVISSDLNNKNAKFDEKTFERIAKISMAKEKNSLDFILEVEGNYGNEHYYGLSEAGAECFVVGDEGLFKDGENLTQNWYNFVNDFTNTDLKFKTEE